MKNILNWKLNPTFTGVVAWVLRVIILLTVLGELFFVFVKYQTMDSGNHLMNMFTGTLLLILTFLPGWLARKNQIYLSPVLQLIIILFLFASMYLGEMRNLYSLYWWWDSMLHGISGVILGVIGITLTYYLNASEKVTLTLSPFFVALFAFAFAIAMGVIWEIFEFTMDYNFGMNMQKSIYVKNISEITPYINKWRRLMDPGLLDTMKDLIIDMLGSLIASIWGYIYIVNSKKVEKDNDFNNLNDLENSTDSFTRR